LPLAFESPLLLDVLRGGLFDLGVAWGDKVYHAVPPYEQATVDLFRLVLAENSLAFHPDLDVKTQRHPPVQEDPRVDHRLLVSSVQQRHILVDVV
jgi:hypothetical protein